MKASLTDKPKRRKIQPAFERELHSNFLKKCFPHTHTHTKHIIQDDRLNRTNWFASIVTIDTIELIDSKRYKIETNLGPKETESDLKTEKKLQNFKNNLKYWKERNKEHMQTNKKIKKEMIQKVPHGRLNAKEETHICGWEPCTLWKV